MTKEQAIAMLDEHKNKLLDPVELLNWTWLRAIVAAMTIEEYETALERAAEELSR